MHEHHFIQNIIKQVPNKEKVSGIALDVGELVGIEHHHLNEHLVAETGWKVSTMEIKSSVECSCGYKGRARIKQRLHDLVIYDCPKCGNLPDKVLKGKDIKIARVIYKDN